MGDVQFFEGGEGGEIADPAQAVGLDAQYLEIRECRQSRYLCDLVLSKPQFLKLRQRLQPRDFPDAVRAQLDLVQICQPFEVLNHADFVLDKVQVFELR